MPGKFYIVLGLYSSDQNTIENVRYYKPSTYHSTKKQAYLEILEEYRKAFFQINRFVDFLDAQPDFQFLSGNFKETLAEVNEKEIFRKVSILRKYWKQNYQDQKFMWLRVSRLTK